MIETQPEINIGHRNSSLARMLTRLGGLVALSLMAATTVTACGVVSQGYTNPCFTTVQDVNKKEIEELDKSCKVLSAQILHGGYPEVPINVIYDTTSELNEACGGTGKLGCYKGGNDIYIKKETFADGISEPLQAMFGDQKPLVHEAVHAVGDPGFPGFQSADVDIQTKYGDVPTGWVPFYEYTGKGILSAPICLKSNGVAITTNGKPLEISAGSFACSIDGVEEIEASLVESFMIGEQTPNLTYDVDILMNNLHSMGISLTNREMQAVWTQSKESGQFWENFSATMQEKFPDVDINSVMTTVVEHIFESTGDIIILPPEADYSATIVPQTLITGPDANGRYTYFYVKSSFEGEIIEHSEKRGMVARFAECPQEYWYSYKEGDPNYADSKVLGQVEITAEDLCKIKEKDP